MTNVNEKNSEVGDPEKHRERRTPRRGGDINAYEATGADLLVARRSSIRSRSTSQYLSAESRSLSGWSQRRDLSGSSVLGPGSLAVRCSLRLDFARRHLPRRPRGTAPITVFTSFVFSLCNSQPDSATAVTNHSAPSPVFNSGGDGKFHEHGQSFSFSRTHRWPYQQDIRLEKITQPTEIQSCERFTRVSSDI
jgi:hypothetical protein